MKRKVEGRTKGGNGTTVIINNYKMKSFVLYQQGITGKTNYMEMK